MRFWRTNRVGMTIALAGLFGLSVACKNVSDGPQSLSAEGPLHSLDYSYVKFATYSGDVVLSAGEYLGKESRAEVIRQAQLDLESARAKSCVVGTRTSFCSVGAGEKIDWIQLFMPDASSCSVGPVPTGVDLEPCESPSQGANL